MFPGGEGHIKLNEKFKTALVTLGGAGLLRPAPGTWGSLAATIVLFGLHGLIILFVPPTSVFVVWSCLLVVGILLLGTINVALGPWIFEYFGREDPGQCVVDEGAGMCLTLLFLPIGNGIGTGVGAGVWRTLIPFAAAFAAFRLFDVLKPPPARQLENLPSGWGILLDDLAAAVYANLLCQLVLRLL